MKSIDNKGVDEKKKDVGTPSALICKYCERTFKQKDYKVENELER